MDKRGKNYFMGGSSPTKGNGLIGVPQNQRQRSIEEVLGDVALIQQEDAFNLKLNDEEIKAMNESFKLWLDDTSEIEKYKHLIVTDNKLIVRLFYFETERKGTLLGADAKPLKVCRVLPYVKILRSSTPEFTEGSILCTSSRVASLELNKEWKGWKMLLERGGEKQYEDLAEPEKYTGMLLDWKRESQFILDPTNPTIDDEYTFVRSTLNFPVIYKLK